MGTGLYDSLGGVDVAYFSAHGNARDIHERMSLPLRTSLRTETLSSMGHVIKVVMRRSAVAVVVLLMLASSPLPAGAHKGPPFPIIENRRVGPYVVALWTHPDVGTGTFFVLIDPTAGGKVPADLKVSIGVQPESGRLPEVVYAAQRDSSRGQVEYSAAAEFDRDEFWRIRLILQSSEGGGEALSRVEATPPGYGRWDLLLYMLPFLAIALLWFVGIGRHRKRKRNAKLQTA
jgi:hypothetical protein